MYIKGVCSVNVKFKLTGDKNKQTCLRFGDQEYFNALHSHDPAITLILMHNLCPIAHM